jgi:hypothetical protein
MSNNLVSSQRHMIIMFLLLLLSEKRLEKDGAMMRVRHPLNGELRQQHARPILPKHTVLLSKVKQVYSLIILSTRVLLLLLDCDDDDNDDNESC